MTEVCGSPHPEYPEIHCSLDGPHPDHTGIRQSDQYALVWANADYVEPPKASPTRRGAAEAGLAGIAAGIPDRISPGDRARNAGFADAEAGTDPVWAQHFDRVLRRLAGSGEDFTSEDITAEVGQPPGHPNAVGARIGAASRKGLIFEVGVRKADRENQHSARLTVWNGREVPREEI